MDEGALATFPASSHGGPAETSLKRKKHPACTECRQSKVVLGCCSPANADGGDRYGVINPRTLAQDVKDWAYLVIPILLISVSTRESKIYCAMFAFRSRSLTALR